MHMFALFMHMALMRACPLHGAQTIECMGFPRVCANKPATPNSSPDPRADHNPWIGVMGLGFVLQIANVA